MHKMSRLNICCRQRRRHGDTGRHSPSWLGKVRVRIARLRRCACGSLAFVVEQRARADRSPSWLSKVRVLIARLRG